MNRWRICWHIVLIQIFRQREKSLRSVPLFAIGAGEIVVTLLLYRVDANVRSLPPNPPLAEGQTAIGLTPLELAAGDERLVELLTTYCGTQGEVIPFVNEA